MRLWEGALEGRPSKTQEHNGSSSVHCGFSLSQPLFQQQGFKTDDGTVPTLEKMNLGIQRTFLRSLNWKAGKDRI
jgi:hypothetical protein